MPSKMAVGVIVIQKCDLNVMVVANIKGRMKSRLYHICLLNQV